MIKTGYNYRAVTRNERFSLKGVTSLTISNWGNYDIEVFGRTLPALSGANPACFRIDGDGSQTDLDFTIEFESGKGGLVYIDYRSIINC
ncbi:hypothetical protein [Flavobacterium cerinum]|uniref:Uncharacterized protein n=1 Tax=Flavobacterium cerinum TaxID=2502784 RepID=A0ABY5IS20_9FLAO|nr:hypothetical protein [Flavobacterium cerinum]UUC45579.1 hypothetical protein NOX80_18405 [Flavobacterium cerinum]